VCELGGMVVAMSDSSGVIYNNQGLDVSYVDEIKTKNKRIHAYLDKYPQTFFSADSKHIWNFKADIALPSATQNEVQLVDAKKLVDHGIIGIFEGANMPLTKEASAYVIDQGVIFIPGKAANAGGVSVSYFEMVQNKLKQQWTKEDVDKKLKDVMTNIFNNIYKEAERINQKMRLDIASDLVGYKRLRDKILKG
jgi:glutamate dehydrogenase (NADP+)